MRLSWAKGRLLEVEDMLQALENNEYITGFITCHWSVRSTSTSNCICAGSSARINDVYAIMTMSEAHIIIPN